MMEDIAILTGDKFISDDHGRAKRITVDKENTPIVSCNDNSAAGQARIAQPIHKSHHQTCTNLSNKAQPNLASVVLFFLPRKIHCVKLRCRLSKF